MRLSAGELFPLLVQAGYARGAGVAVCGVCRRLAPGACRRVHAPDIFTAMVEGVRNAVLERGMMTESEWEQGIADLHRTCEPDGVFCYTFFKATGTVLP